MADIVDTNGKGRRARRAPTIKPIAKAEAGQPLTGLATIGDAVAAQVTPSPAQLAETIEAVTSPAATISDAIPAPAIDPRSGHSRPT